MSILMDNGAKGMVLKMAKKTKERIFLFFYTLLTIEKLKVDISNLFANLL